MRRVVRRALLHALDGMAGLLLALAVWRLTSSRRMLRLASFLLLPERGGLLLLGATALAVLRLSWAWPRWLIAAGRHLAAACLRVRLRFRLRMPPGTGFVLGAWILREAAVWSFLFLSTAIIPRPDGVHYARPWIEPYCWNWDSSWYLRLAREGYPSWEFGQFFPFLPLVIRATTAVTGDACRAGVLVIRLSLLAAIAGVYAVTRRRYGDGTARAAVAVVLAYPFSFFYSTVYTESVVVALATWAFWLAERRRFWAAGLLGALAAGTRLTGAALFPALLAMGLADDLASPGRWRDRLRRAAAARLPLLAIPAATASFFVYLHFRVGDFWAQLHAQRQNGRTFELGLASLRDATMALVRPSASTDWQWLFAGFLLLALAIIPMLVRLGREPGGVPYVLFVLGLLGPALVTTLEGFGRYTSAAFPLAWVLVLWTERRPGILGVVLGLLGLFQGLFLLMHAHGMWIT